MRFCRIAACCLVVAWASAWAGAASAQESKVSFKESADSVDFLLKGKLAARYRFDDSLPRPLFWPVLAPGGVPVTRAWPLDKSVKGESTDHPHQQSMWFTHGDVIPEGATLTAKLRGIEGADFWSIAKGHGVIRLVKRETPKTTKNGIVFVSENHWLQDKLIVLKEKRILTFQQAPNGWVVILETHLTPHEHPIIFGDTKEGAMGLRVNDQMRADKVGNGQIRQPGGKKGEKECWGQRAHWCDYAGTVNGEKVGVTVFAAKSNPVPSVWHVRGYGLMAANPFGRKRANFPGSRDLKDLVRLKKGETFRLVYAVHVYAGQRSEMEIEETAKKLWQ